MTAKEFLKGIKKDIIKIELLEKEIARLKAARDGIITRGEFIPGKHGRHTMDMSDVLAKIDKYIEADNALHGSLIDRRKQAQDMIFAMDNENYIKILYGYYLLGDTFDDIAHDLNYSYIWVIKMHGHALQEIDKKNI